MINSILIVNKDPHITELLESSFQTENYMTKTALNAAQAIKLFAQAIPEIIVLDIRLPSRGAITFLETIRKTPAGKSVPIICMGDIFAKEPLKRKALGAKYNIVHFLKKPFRVSQLLSMTSELLHNKTKAKSTSFVKKKTSIKTTGSFKKTVSSKRAPAQKLSNSLQDNRIPSPEKISPNEEYIDLIEPDQIEEFSYKKQERKFSIPRSQPKSLSVQHRIKETSKQTINKSLRESEIHAATLSSTKRMRQYSKRASMNEKQSTSDKPCVVIVDDEVMILRILKKILDNEGWQVYTTYKSTDALTLSFKYLPDLVISDIMMPEMDGYTLCRMIKSQKKLEKTKVVLLTAKNLSEDKGKGFKSGADFFMQKPINKTKLLSVLKNLLE